MKIVIVVPYELSQSGIIVFIERLSQQFSHLGFHISLAISSSEPSKSDRNIINFKTIQSLMNWLLETKYNYDILFWAGFYQHSEEINDLVRCSVTLREKFNKKVFHFWERTGEPNVIPDPKVLQLFIEKGTDGIIVLNAEQACNLNSKGAPPYLVHLIPTGIDTKVEFTPVANNIERKKLKKCFGWPINSITVLSAGRFEKRKHTDFLLETWLKNQTSNNKAQLVLIGSGFGHQDSIEAEVFDLAGRSSNTLVIPYRSGMDRPSYYRASDIFVALGELEGEPTVLIEAMACGLPVIATNIPGHRGLVLDEKTGLLIELNNELQLCDSLDKLIDNESYRLELGKEARELAARQRDISSIAAKLISVFIPNKDYNS